MAMMDAGDRSSRSLVNEGGRSRDSGCGYQGGDRDGQSGRRRVGRRRRNEVVVTMTQLNGLLVMRGMPATAVVTVVTVVGAGKKW
jgi:hypothetical protein